MLKKLLIVEVILLLVFLVVARVLTVGPLFPPPPHSFGVELGQPLNPALIRGKLPIKEEGYVLHGVPYPFPGIPVYLAVLDDNKNVKMVGASGDVDTIKDCRASKKIVSDHYKRTYMFPDVETPYVTVWMFDTRQLIVSCEKVSVKRFAVTVAVKDYSLIKGETVSKINSTNDF